MTADEIDIACILGAFGIVPPSPSLSACGIAMASTDADPDAETCGGMWHYRGGAARSRCPEWLAGEVRKRVVSERARLDGLFVRLEREGGSGWDGFDTEHAHSRLAFDACKRLAAGRPPDRGLVFAGKRRGQGKTRLMLAAYFDLLTAGVDARWITAVDLLEINAALRDPFNDERRNDAEAMVQNLQRAAVIFFDDVGLPDDERRVGDFRERLKHLLDTSRAVWAWSTNLSMDQLHNNPEVGPQNVSRLMSHAEVLVIDAPDRRIAGVLRVA